MIKIRVPKGMDEILIEAMHANQPVRIEYPHRIPHGLYIVQSATWSSAHAGPEFSLIQVNISNYSWG